LVNHQFPNYRFINCNEIFNLNYFLKQKELKKNRSPSLQNFKNQLCTSFASSTVFNCVPDVVSLIISTQNKVQWSIVISSYNKPP
jgi:hypothetical protein